MMRRTFWIFLMPALALFQISTAFATPDPAAYDQMAQAKAMVEMLKMPTAPDSIRETLLKEARAEDLAFVKSMLVHWKKNSSQNISAEFNHVILKDQSGTEILHMFPIENAPGKFEINGREWTIPEKGSISSSLTKHLSPKAASSSIFDFVSRAYAARDVSQSVMPAVYYTMATEKPTLGDAAALHLKLFDTAKNFAIQDNFFQSVFEKLGGKKPAVTCTSEEASGRFTMGLETMTFKVRKDGSVLLTPSESKKTFMIKNADANNWRTGVSYQECADPGCTSTTGPVKNRISSLIKLKTPVEVDVAYTFRTRDGDQNKFPIVFDCPERTECDHMVIGDRDKLSAADRKEADRVTVDANKALERSKLEQNEAIMSLRPLFACCQETKCQKAVLSSGIRMNNAESSGAKTTR